VPVVALQSAAYARAKKWAADQLEAALQNCRFVPAYFK